MKHKTTEAWNIFMVGNKLPKGVFPVITLCVTWLNNKKSKMAVSGQPLTTISLSFLSTAKAVANSVCSVSNAFASEKKRN